MTTDTPETDSCPAERIEGLCGQLERERNHWKSESLEQAKLLAMSADREEKLRSQIAALKSEISNFKSS